MGKGILTEPPQANRRQARRQGQQLQGLSKQQNKLVNQQQKADLNLGKTANQQMGNIRDSYQTQIDYDGAPQAPVQGDYNQWVDSQMANYNQAFDQRYNPVFDQQNQDIDQQLANKGIPMGSELYEREKNRILQSQNDARTQAYAQNQSQAVNSANSLFNIGTQARQNNLAEQFQQRNQALSDYSSLMGAQSGMAGQNLNYSQTLGAQNNQADQQIRAANATYHAPSGPGPTAWAQYGFGSPQELDAYNTALQRDQAVWAQGLQNQNQPKQPNQYAGILGSVAGAALGGWAQSGFET